MIVTKCACCNKEIKVKPSHLKEMNYCSKECHYKHSTERVIMKVEKEKGINLKEWFYQKYIVEKVPLIKISQMLGVCNRTPPKLLKYYGIKKNTRSESIANQWIDNEQRRKEQSEFAKVKLTSKEARAKLSEVMQSEEYRKKQSISKLGERNGMYNKVGDLNPAFKGDITIEERIKNRQYFLYKRWKKEVLEKANHTCQCCGKSDVKLNTHHLNSYTDFPTQRTDINNGVCLCEDCHKLFHKLYGGKHNTKEQFEDFMNNR